jgi:hypothetical protein
VSEEACSTSWQTAPPTSKRSISKKKEPFKIYPRRKGGQPTRSAHQVLVTQEMLEKVRISHAIIPKIIDDDGRSRGGGTRALVPSWSATENHVWCIVGKPTSWGGACLTVGECAAFREVSARCSDRAGAVCHGNQEGLPPFWHPALAIS